MIINQSLPHRPLLTVQLTLNRFKFSLHHPEAGKCPCYPRAKPGKRNSPVFRYPVRMTLCRYARSTICLALTIPHTALDEPGKMSSTFKICPNCMAAQELPAGLKHYQRNGVDFMKMILKTWVLVALTLLLPGIVRADDSSFAPGGTAIDQHAERFQDLKIIMDLKAKDVDTVKYSTMVATRVLEHPGTKLVVIIEGPFVAMFAKKNYLDHQGIVDQWVDLANKGVHVEYCGNSVQGAHLLPSDMEGLTEKNPAVVNPGAYPSMAHYESLGYALIVPIQIAAPAK